MAFPLAHPGDILPSRLECSSSAANVDLDESISDISKRPRFGLREVHLSTNPFVIGVRFGRICKDALTLRNSVLGSNEIGDQVQLQLEK